MIPGRLQYFLERFRNDQKCDQIWTLGPRIYHQHISKHTRKHGNVLEHIMFHFWESAILKIVEGLRTYIFEISGL